MEGDRGSEEMAREMEIGKEMEMARKMYSWETEIAERTETER
jgi:hypothetical protein